MRSDRLVPPKEFFLFGVCSNSCVLRKTSLRLEYWLCWSPLLWGALLAGTLADRTRITTTLPRKTHQLHSTRLQSSGLDWTGLACLSVLAASDSDVTELGDLAKSQYRKLGPDIWLSGANVMLNLCAFRNVSGGTLMQSAVCEKFSVRISDILHNSSSVLSGPCNLLS